MKCYCCDKLLSDFESTRKSKSTGEYLDMCNACYKMIQDVVPTIATIEDSYEEEYLDTPDEYSFDRKDFTDEELGYNNED